MPRRITTGFETLTYALDVSGLGREIARPLILRIFHQTGWPEQVRFEAAVQNAVAAQGFPAARVLCIETDGELLGAPFMVMERLPGVAMLEMVRSPVAGRRAAAMLAQTQAALHSLAVEPVRRAIEEAGAARAVTVDGWLDQLAARIDAASLDGLRPGLRWAFDHRPPASAIPVVCHGDYHPNNVLVYNKTVSGVIDWSLTKIADPALDVGNTRVIIMLGPRDVPAILQPLAGLLSRSLARRYYAAYRRLRPVDAGAVRYYEALRCLASLVWAGEHRAGAGRGVDLGPNPWAAPRESKRLIKHFRSISSVELSLPPA
jgi:aminoglycoside phosphotransferase (APT) family kinase protein